MTVAQAWANLSARGPQWVLEFDPGARSGVDRWSVCVK